MGDVGSGYCGRIALMLGGGGDGVDPDGDGDDSSGGYWW